MVAWLLQFSYVHSGRLSNPVIHIKQPSSIEWKKQQQQMEMIKLRGKRKKKKAANVFLSFSNTRVVKDQIAATENSRAQLMPCVSVVTLPWCPTSVISQPRGPEMSLFSRPARANVSPSDWVILQTGRLSSCG